MNIHTHRIILIYFLISIAKASIDSQKSDNDVANTSETSEKLNYYDARDDFLHTMDMVNLVGGSCTLIDKANQPSDFKQLLNASIFGYGRISALLTQTKSIYDVTVASTLAAVFGKLMQINLDDEGLAVEQWSARVCSMLEIAEASLLSTSFKILADRLTKHCGRIAEVFLSQKENDPIDKNKSSDSINDYSSGEGVDVVWSVSTECLMEFIAPNSPGGFTSKWTFVTFKHLLMQLSISIIMCEYQLRDPKLLDDEIEGVENLLFRSWDVLEHYSNIQFYTQLDGASGIMTFAQSNLMPLVKRDGDKINVSWNLQNEFEADPSSNSSGDLGLAAGDNASSDGEKPVATDPPFYSRRPRTYSMLSDYKRRLSLTYEMSDEDTPDEDDDFEREDEEVIVEKETESTPNKQIKNAKNVFGRRKTPQNKVFRPKLYPHDTVSTSSVTYAIKTNNENQIQFKSGAAQPIDSDIDSVPRAKASNPSIDSGNDSVPRAKASNPSIDSGNDSVPRAKASNPSNGSDIDSVPRAKASNPSNGPGNDSVPRAQASNPSNGPGNDSVPRAKASKPSNGSDIDSVPTAPASKPSNGSDIDSVPTAPASTSKSVRGTTGTGSNSKWSSVRNSVLKNKTEENDNNEGPSKASGSAGGGLKGEISFSDTVSILRFRSEPLRWTENTKVEANMHRKMVNKCQVEQLRPLSIDYYNKISPPNLGHPVMGRATASSSSTLLPKFMGIGAKVSKTSNNPSMDTLSNFWGMQRHDKELSGIRKLDKTVSQMAILDRFSRLADTCWDVASGRPSGYISPETMYRLGGNRKDDYIHHVTRVYPFNLVKAYRFLVTKEEPQVQSNGDDNFEFSLFLQAPEFVSILPNGDRAEALVIEQKLVSTIRTLNTNSTEDPPISVCGYVYKRNDVDRVLIGEFGVKLPSTILEHVYKIHTPYTILIHAKFTDSKFNKLKAVMQFLQGTHFGDFTLKFVYKGMVPSKNVVKDSCHECLIGHYPIWKFVLTTISVPVLEIFICALILSRRGIRIRALYKSKPSDNQSGAI
ncbi:hypothetical protein BmR1_04g07915 [Babesia microti strain RI]|uniref:Uncharacterized protein n=1 Tax=Babesia microti (strain RI) TaxID=1133968 RepID=I7I9W9_BABMR|nr:hypothetical protein BmR1_04g07915 [Babesia microti strain RI]CCF75769.1 hypothetical protein BmR1_04g07915 [Babesia microti strain RI]|eukprot:XP_012650177.1 hypothetical protein BmR1_04g07915 [Babesia microti strain RI]